MGRAGRERMRGERQNGAAVIKNWVDGWEGKRRYGERVGEREEERERREGERNGR